MLGRMRGCTTLVSGGTREPRAAACRARHVRIVSASGVPMRALAQPVTTHDFEKARVIREAERFGRSGDVPVVLVEGAHHDLAFSLRPQRPECARRCGWIAPFVLFVAKDFWWRVRDR